MKTLVAIVIIVLFIVIDGFRRDELVKRDNEVLRLKSEVKTLKNESYNDMIEIIELSKICDKFQSSREEKENYFKTKK